MQLKVTALKMACAASILAAMANHVIAQSARPDQLRPEEAAAIQLLGAGRGAFNERRYDIAAERFGLFLRQHGNHREARWAQLGLGLALLELPQKDYKAAADMLAQPAGDGAFPYRPIAAYYQGVALRALGLASLAQAAANPGDAANMGRAANQRFAEAERAFALAVDLLDKQIKAIKPTTAPDEQASHLANIDLATRARLDRCEMLLRMDRAKDALPIAAALLESPTPAVDSQAATAAGEHVPAATYLAGHAQFQLGDYLAAGRLLSKLVPFAQEFGPHARYLLARCHHLGGETPEAAVQYAAVLADYDAARKSAQQKLANPAKLSPAQRDFLQALQAGPAPEYVARATFYSGVLLSETERYAEALTRFNAVTGQFPKSPLVPEAQARAGFCLLQTRDTAKAVATLTPILEHPLVGDLACWWLGRTNMAAADPNNQQAFEATVRGAIDLFRKAADKAAQRAAAPPGSPNHDPSAKLRRADMLMDLADAQQAIAQHKEAAASYGLVVSEKADPARVEEAFQRQVTAMHLAGQYRESDGLAQRFISTYPKSLLAGAVVFRTAENAYMLAKAAAAAGQPRQQVDPLYVEAAKRYENLLRQFPDFEHANMARQGLAACQYQLGKFTEAAATLAGIADADRTDMLADASYVQADCLIRTLPPEGEDALEAARVIEQLERASKLLEAFVGSQPKAPQTPDAMLKLGCCQLRIGALLADVKERQARLTRAREVFDQLMRQFPKEPLIPSVILERAKCLALLGNVGGAVQELARVQADQFRTSPAAPLAALRQISLMRAQNRARDAANFAQQARAWHEPTLLKDPALADIAAAIQYEHAVALREANAPAEALPIFENIVKQFGKSVHATNAVWRVGQIRRDELTAAIAAARTVLMRSNVSADESAAALKSLNDARAAMQQLIGSLMTHAGEQEKSASGSEAHMRMLYEAAWCWRMLADAELELAANKVRQDLLAAARARVSRHLPAGQSPPGYRPPVVTVAELPVQPGEGQTRQQYEKLIAAKPEAELANQARYELAELLIQRNELPGASELLVAALEHNPSAELAELIRLRLAVVLLAQGPGKHDAALSQAQRIGKRPEEPLFGPARLVEAEVRLAQSDWPRAIALLTPFRDHGQLANRANLSDRALLRLGQAYAQINQLDQSRQAYQLLTQRFPQSEFVEEAFFGLGWTHRQQEQFDHAVAAFAEVTRRTCGDVAARAQLHTGLCRLKQQRWADAARELLVVSLVYDYPELATQARFEAAGAYLQLEQPAEAAKLYQQVIDEQPKSQWAEQARKKLAEVTP